MVKKLNPHAPSFHPSSSMQPNQASPQSHHHFPPVDTIPQIIAPHNNNHHPTRTARHRRRQASVPPRLRPQNGAAGCGGRREAEKAKKQRPVVTPVEYGRNTSTIMIRNIPNRYTREMLIDFLERHCLYENQKLADKKEEHATKKSAFDLVYLPIDFRTHMNLGYGFVNFTNPDAAWRFCLGTNGQKWEFFQSNKVRYNVTARHQGKKRLMEHLKSMKLPPDLEDFWPVCFSPPRDGIIKGSQRTLGNPAEISPPPRITRHFKEKEKKTPSPAAIHNVSSEAI